MRAEYKPRNTLGEEINRLARSFKVSTLVVLGRIHDAGGLTQDEFWRAYRKELERLQAMPAGSGGDFYLTLGARAGERFARAPVVSPFGGRLSFTEAVRLLGFKQMPTFRQVGHSLGIGVSRL